MKEETKCYCGHTTKCDCGPETLEEASERLATAPPKIFKEVAKWQQERNYSEEDMMDYSNYRLLIKKALSPKEWFEQFKKK